MSDPTPISASPKWTATDDSLPTGKWIEQQQINEQIGIENTR